MPVKITKKVTRKKEVQPVTRRQFLKEASLVMGGVVITSLAFNLACGSPESTTTSTTTTTSKVTTTPTIPAPTPTTTTPPTTTTSLPPDDGFVYVTPTEPPPKIPIPGCITYTATDRMYIIEHMWIKLVAENIVVIGITEKMSELCGTIYSLYLPEEGRTLKKDGYFGYAEAAKISVEFFSPVSGTIIQINHEMWPDLDLHVNDDPYVSGWWMTIQLSDPEELNTLLIPQEYTDLNAKKALDSH